MDTTVQPQQKRRARFRAPQMLNAIPSWLWYVGLFVVPVAFVVVASFGSKVPGSAGRVDFSHPSLGRYREALDQTLLTVLIQTLRTSIVGTALCLIISLPVAYYLATKVSESKRGLLLALLIVPFFTNFLIRTMAWRIVLAPKGFISNLLVDWGLRDSGLNLLDTRFALQIGVVYNYLPLMIFPLFVALDRLDPALREASKDLGANRWKTFVQVTLPLAMPGIVAGLVLVFVPLSGDYITAAILGGAKGNMAGALVAAQFLQAQNPALGAAVAVVLIAAILAILGAFAVIGKLTVSALRRHRSVAVVSR
ncbi:MAG: ABC transporter permease [Ilumatobacteraceae bacterium]